MMVGVGPLSLVVLITLTGLTTSIIMQQYWRLGGTTDCTFGTSLQTSAVAKSAIQCIARMQPYQGQNRAVSYNQVSGECSVIDGSVQPSAPGIYVTVPGAFPVLTDQEIQQDACTETWQKVFEIAANTNVMYGSVANVILAVERGDEMRIEQKPNMFLESEYVLIKSGVVCSSSVFVLSKKSWDEFADTMEWEFTMICTSGKVYVGRTYLGDNVESPLTIANGHSVWFTRKLRQPTSNTDPVYCSTPSGAPSCGDVVNVVEAARLGLAIRTITIDESGASTYLATSNRMELSTGQGECELFSQLTWKLARYVGPTVQYPVPYIWHKTLQSTNGTVHTTRWYIGDHSLFRQSTDVNDVNWFVDGCWVFMYSHNENGVLALGSLQNLIQQIMYGKRVRIVFDGFAMEADNIIVVGSLVTAQLLSQIDTETPITYPFEDAVWKWVRIMTDGTFLVNRYELGSTQTRGKVISTMAASWFVDNRQWQPVLSTDTNGAAVSGSKSDLEQAIRNGYRLRCVIQMSATTRLSVTVDNVEIHTDGNVAGQVFRLINFGNVNDMNFIPYWRLLILTTNGEMKETHWTVGAHTDRGQAISNVDIEWFVG